MKIDQLVRKNIRELQPYVSARSLFSEEGDILLDANENGEDLFGGSLNRYPDPLQKQLKTRIAELKNVPPECIFLGNGSDEAIDLLLRIFCEPGEDEIIICPPTYGMYRVQAAIHGTPLREVPLDKNFDLLTSDILAAVQPKTKLLFLCSPNNPTGNLLGPKDIEKLLRVFPGIVVVDEAYIDFAGQASWTARLAEFPQLVVLQTFSKAWALAGARLGMAFASPEILHYLNAVKFPYNVSLPTQQAALRALQSGGVEHSIKQIIAERKRLAKRLTEIPRVRRVHPSDANFLLVEFDHARSTFRFLHQQNVIVRDRSKEHNCANCLRLTVGTPEENDELLARLEIWAGMRPDTTKIKTENT